MWLKDLIGLFVRHRNASNLLMVLMLTAGIVAVSRLNTQFFPNIGIDIVSVTVAWPGATAEDVESNIVAAIEPEVRFIDSVDRVVSFAVEGSGSVVIEFAAEADMQSALSDVEAAVGRITTLPEDSERPLVRRIVRYDTISRIVLSGPFSEASLKATAKRIRDDLLARGIDQVTLFGARDEEIWVEVDPATLRRLDLSLGDIAGRIRASSQNLPSGTLEGRFEAQIRSLGLPTDARGYGDIEVRALENGRKIYLRDVARLSDTFDDSQPIGRRHGHPSVSLHVQRATSADALDQARIVNDYVTELKPTLGRELKLEHYDIQASFIRDRINLLLRNGLGGLILVLGVLFLFLSGRLAFWVAAGIPVAMMATLGVMLLSGQSINMISLFALIMTLGIIVDDAIVVGEHAATRRAQGLGVIEAAEAGALRMLAPVTSASLTTIAAFLPILLISSIIGQVVKAIPLVVVAVLIASLVECFLVLPGHLRHALLRPEEKGSRFRLWFDGHFGRFRDGPFRRFVAMCVRWRYLSVAAALALLAVSGGMVAGGRLDFHFFPSPEADTIYANIEFVPGTPRRQTAEMLAGLGQALDRAEGKLGEGELVQMSFGKLGISQSPEFQSQRGDHLGGLHVELVPADRRQARTKEFVEAWRREIEMRPGINRVSLSEFRHGPPGREIDVRLSGGSTAALKAAARETQALLARFEGVSDVEDDLPYGKREIILEVTPRGRALGFTVESVGRQVRDTFEGRIAKRFARIDEEVAVRVRFPRDTVDGGTLRALYLRGPKGAEVPLSQVVTIRQHQGFSRIRREDGRRQVSVVGEVDENKTSAQAVLTALAEGELPAIARRHGVDFEFKGRSEEQAQTLDEMRLGAMIGLAAIYIILAWVFASYSRPFVVMAIIPFGLIGAILGHWVMGFDLTILSLIALLGLAGVLVNDSIILVSTIDERMAAGQAAFEAIVDGARDRLRAVLLTSLTTIGGLLPLMFETSLQARFIIPMAVTIVFGLAVGTLLVLIVVPALLAIQEDIRRVL
ncbi:MAG TPA: efflux RND transporter permease subunit [Alphaproteobacteria bacterium]|jgi:multidrug efflux pump subunit AcrB|nr:efflux RND transporter permease subunit [Alphaproteobacteria bacterium]MDP7429396.1 efflux RND transporter permease subunit [Alphaproteobacteria bacterium]HJM50974.1 efflux RND transporter permease subunit [Alphaproteobacteria bacterium]